MSTLVVCSPAERPPELPSFERRCRLCEWPVWLSRAMESDIADELVLVCTRCAGITSASTLYQFVEHNQVHVRPHQLRLLQEVAPRLADGVQRLIDDGKAVLDE